MTTRESPFGDRPFVVSDGAARNLGRGAMAGKRFERPFYGVRRWAPPEPPAPKTEVEEREVKTGYASKEMKALRRSCEALAARMQPWHFFSHDAALALAGSPTPRNWKATVHVSAYRPMQPPRVSGMIGHRLQTRDAAAWQADGLPIEHPARAWVQASRQWPADDLIAAADFLVLKRRGLVTIDELRAEARLMRASALDDILSQVRNGSESPEETRLRLALVRSGLPEPELNQDLFSGTGRFVARLDQSYPEYRVAVEYDGRHHATDGEQFARDADRWDAIRAERWFLVRILSHHMRDDAVSAVNKVRAALQQAGWRYGTP